MPSLPMLVRALTILLLAALAGPTHGQGLLVNEQPGVSIRLPRPGLPTRPTPDAGAYRVESVDINATLNDQVARVQVAQKFVNTGSRPMEVAFVFPLPHDGAIDQLTLLVDGKEFEARLLPADEARELYEAIVRKNRDPALLEWIGHGLYRTSVFPVPAGAERTVTLRYTQVCRQSGGLTDFLFPLRAAKYTSQPLERLKLRLTIEGRTPITSVYSPTHQVRVERPSPRRAIVTHESTQSLPASDFRLFFDSQEADGQLAANLVSYRPNPDEPGYFLLLASPPLQPADEAPPAKTVLFVVDRSGSMGGKKIEQAKGALRFVLNNLREGDTFNIIAYDTKVETFRSELQRVGEQTRESAMAFIDGLFAGGSTNISGALKRALRMLDDSSRPTYVVFLTDGLPTAGEQKEAKIVNLAKKANRVRARLFAFGVGYDVNSRLLDKLARANFGQSEYVRPNQDIEASIARLYNRIGTPVMIDVELRFAYGNADADRFASGVGGVYPKGSFDLFAGDQVVLVGRYSQPGRFQVTLTGAVAGKTRSFRFPTELEKKSGDDTNAFVARLWATRRVGEIIDQIDLHGRNEELIDELVALATRHGIITQYTSFLADESADHNASARNRDLALGEAEALEETGGRFAFQQRGGKLALLNAPAAAAAPSSGLRGGGGFGGSAPTDADGTTALNIALGCPTYYDARSDATCVAANIRQIGRKTFFQRMAKDGPVWCDSAVSDAEQRDATPIERFSDAYFALVQQHGSAVAPYLAIDEPVVIKLGGKVYTW